MLLSPKIGALDMKLTSLRTAVIADLGMNLCTGHMISYMRTAQTTARSRG